MATVTKHLTLEQFLELPERKPALEFEVGRITQKVSPKQRHSRLQSKLAEVFNVMGEPARLALALTELRETYAGRSYVPDVSVFTWDRIQRDEDGEPIDDVFVPPDIAIEIRSPRQRLDGLIERCRWYVGNGVRLALLVDPIRRCVILFLPGQEPEELRDNDAIEIGDLLPSFRLTVEELFASLRIV